VGKIRFNFVIKKLALILICIFAAVCGLASCSGVGYQLKGHDGLQPVYHKVRSGDTIAKIASSHGVKVESLLWLNGIRERGFIRVGELLLVSYDFRHSNHSHTHQHSSTSNKTKTKSSGTQRASLGGIKPKPQTNYKSGELYWPIKTGRIVSKFGPRKKSFHDGIDIAAPSGTAVFAAHNGEVVYSDDGLRGYGNLLILRARSGMLTVYAHNRKLYVSAGQKVKRGQKIAAVGSTGKSTGPHLHFEVRTRDKKGRYLAVDPIAFFDKEAGPPRYRVNESLTPLLAKQRQRG